jgi:thiol-disulfide isomerase/thioredoxin
VALHSVFFWALLLSSPSPSPPPSPSREPDPPIVSTADQILSVAHASERPTVVHFWASWCEACVRELSEMRQLQRSLKDLDAPLLWISLDPPKDASKVGAFMRGHGLEARALLLDAPDPAPVTSRFNPRWQAELPATFVVLQSGVVAASHLGPTPIDVVLKEVRDLIRASRAGQPSPARRTKP